MSPLDRVTSERHFHDRQASERAAWFACRPHELRFRDDAYLDHETWIRPAFERLGDVAGLDVLDYGCGHGMAAVVLARRGARVTAFDLSGGYVAEARLRAAANDVALDFVQADGERLPFAAGSFDRIWGNAVLHHIDIPTAAAELFRVLRPGGWAVFCEPWGENPLLRWARRRLPYAGKHRTADEEPLRQRQVQQLHAVFPRVEAHGFQLLAMARRVAHHHFHAGLDRWDRLLLEHAPALQRFCRYMVLTLRR
jgi:2-polyprenyl-3-methyl-5-hydroxy-6-metoxy-1,4-benzoquinol methylase